MILEVSGKINNYFDWEEHIISSTDRELFHDNAIKDLDNYYLTHEGICIFYVSTKASPVSPCFL
jgi:hypothetical protein